MKCPKCHNVMEAPRELSEGLPGIKYYECLACGTTRPKTVKPKRERLPAPEKPHGNKS